MNITVKKHPRARHIKLRACIRRGIEVIVPLRFNQKLLPEILEKNKAWINKKLEEIQEQVKALEKPIERLDLKALQNTWAVIYIGSNTNKIKLMTRAYPNELVLMGKVEDKLQCQKILIKWLKQQAERFLISELNKISNEIQLPFKSVVIRGQQTRWASCSSDKSINLNYKLLFLPPELVRHILIHELAHTIHMNHSVRFWRLVAKFDPEWRIHNKAIRKFKIETLGDI